MYFQNPYIWIAGVINKIGFNQRNTVEDLLPSYMARQQYISYVYCKHIFLAANAFANSD